MPLDFPSSPTNGQVYQNYYYDGPTGAWRSLSSTVNPIPSTLKNLTVSSSETTGVSLKVTPFTTSSVNLQEWYNTSSTVVASINVAGDLAVNSLTLTTDLSVANGGTGASSFTSGAYIKGAGSGALTAQVGIPGGDITSGQVGPSFGGTPTGGIMQFAGASAPTGWLMCQGQELAIASYTALYNILTATGTVFPYGANTNGSGAAGTTHFRLPDFRGEVPVGKAASGTFATLGASGGVESTSLDVNHIPQHSHSINHDHGAFNTASAGTHQHLFFMDDGAGIYGGATRYNTIQYDATSGASGNGGWFYTPGGNSAYDGTHAHSIDVPAFTGTSGNYGTATVTPVSALQPYIVINYIIKT